MRLGTMMKWGALGMIAAAMLVLSAWGTKPALAVSPLPFPSGTLPTLLSCPNYNGSDNNMVDIADVTLAISHYRQDYLNGDGTRNTNYWYMLDSMQTGSRGLMRIDDVTYVIGQYRHFCPVLDTQIAKATQALANPNYVDKLCDEAGNYTDPSAICHGDPQFLTENASFLLGKGYRRGSTDVPGQGIHYVNYAYWNGLFNPARPPGLVYKNGYLVAQLYYAAGDTNATIGGSAGVGWGPAPTSNIRAVNLDALPCTPVTNEPATGYSGTGMPGDPLTPLPAACSWAGSYDGFHWHKHLCTYGIGTTQATALPGDFISPPIDTQQKCADFAHTYYGINCTFPPTANFNCAYSDAVGWMGHLWNWYPNANFTNASSPTPNAAGLCQVAYCSTLESNGRFADCFPDGSYNAYDCPQ